MCLYSNMILNCYLNPVKNKHPACLVFFFFLELKKKEVFVHKGKKISEINLDIVLSELS